MNRLIGFLFACISLLFTYNLQAQSESDIGPLIDAADLSKLGKANDYKAEADKLIEEASRLNMEALSILADPALNENSATKKSAQLESQARKKQVQASGLYEKCNEIKFTVYRKYIDKFWKAHPGQEADFLNAKLLEEQASDNYFQAISYRIEAKKMDDELTKIEKLNEADDLEAQAIQKQVTALGAYHHITGTAEQVPLDEREIPAVQEAPAETIGNVPEATLPSRLELNQAEIDRYNRYQAEGQYIDTTLSTGQIAGLSAFETDTVLRLWYDYIYGHEALATEPLLATTPDSLKEGLQARQAPDAGQSAEIGIITDENKDQLVPADENVIYRVQVAANRSELSQRALSRMYYGNKQVEMINENGWYKYSVGDFDTYDEASKFRKSSGISNAYIVAYRKGTTFAPAVEATEIKPPAPLLPEGTQRLPAGLIFRIQVAASRVPLSMDQFKKIYRGTYPVEMIAEEGWYKYQLMGVRLYSDALRLKQSVGSEGAFVVAYEDGVKVNMAGALEKSRELERTVQSRGRKGILEETEYHLQLAASRIPMKSDELGNLYSGTEAISIILEDGWFKYHLKAGNSSEMAEQFKQASRIDKAFIVPYRRAAKITYFEALQETK